MLPIDVSPAAADQIREADEWWRLNRPKAPRAIREDLERASRLISFQPQAGAIVRNISLPGVRRIHLARIRYDLYFRVAESPPRVEILGFWHASRGEPPPIVAP